MKGHNEGQVNEFAICSTTCGRSVLGKKFVPREHVLEMRIGSTGGLLLAAFSNRS